MKPRLNGLEITHRLLGNAAEGGMLAGFQECIEASEDIEEFTEMLTQSKKAVEQRRSERLLDYIEKARDVLGRPVRVRFVSDCGAALDGVRAIGSSGAEGGGPPLLKPKKNPGGDPVYTSTGFANPDKK